MSKRVITSQWQQDRAVAAAVTAGHITLEAASGRYLMFQPSGADDAYFQEQLSGRQLLVPGAADGYQLRQFGAGRITLK